jgi:hypothetical protein
LLLFLLHNNQFLRRRVATGEDCVEIYTTCQSGSIQYTAPLRKSKKIVVALHDETQMPACVDAWAGKSGYGREGSSFPVGLLSGFDYPALFDARCANPHARDFAIDLRANALKVRQPAPPRPVVSMTDVITADGFLSAKIAHSCHDFLNIQTCSWKRRTEDRKKWNEWQIRIVAHAGSWNHDQMKLRRSIA